MVKAGPKLVKMPPGVMKGLGIEQSKKGLMIDKKKLADIKKYQQGADEKPELPGNKMIGAPKVLKEMVNEGARKRDEQKGIY